MSRSRITLNAPLFAVFVLTAAAATAQPRMVVEDAQRDLGTVSEGDVLELEYRIANRGDSPLELDVRPTCGCTVVDADRRIEGGGEGVVTARIDTRGFSGPITKSLLVTSNDPERASLSLVARATVFRAIEILPRPLVRLTNRSGSPARSTVRVVPTGDEVFEITGVDGGAEWLETTLRRLGPDELLPGRGGTQYELELRLGENAPPGFLDTRVTIRTDHDRAPAIELKVVGTSTTI